MKEIGIDLDVHRLIESRRDSFEQSENDILRVLLGLDGPGLSVDAAGQGEDRQSVKKLESAIAIGMRTTGEWLVECGDTRYFARNLREAYMTAISCVAAANPGFLVEFAKEGARRKFVARSAEALYPHSKHLAAPERNNWHRLGDWYVDLNLSSAQAAKRIRRACALAGLRYGPDIVIKDGLSAL